jgi:hypothetical protein
MVICAARWNRNPRPAQLAFLGTVFLLLVAVGRPVMTVVVSNWINPARAGEMLSMLELVCAIVSLTGYGFLLGGVYFGRGGGGSVTPPPRS